MKDGKDGRLLIIYEMQNIGELEEIRKYINSVNMQGKWIALI